MKAVTARTTTSQVISTLLLPYEMAKVELRAGESIAAKNALYLMGKLRARGGK
jgi:hypothetical protein